MERLLIRSSAIAGYPALARSLGLDPARLARRARLNLSSLSSPDHQIPARGAYRLLELSATASGVADFGLRLAATHTRGLSHLSALGLLARDEPDVRRALRRIVDNINLHSTCIALSLQEAQGIAVAGMTLLPDGEPVIRQSVEAALGRLCRTLSGLLGPRWHPITVQFVHSIAGSDLAYRRFFGCPVGFSAVQNAIVLRSAELDLTMPGSDTGFVGRAVGLASLTMPIARKAGVDRVRRSILLLMPTGRCTSHAVADQLGIDRRTMHRHLAAVGRDFTGVLNELRMELARHYLSAGDLRVTDVASQLGFNSPSSFSRWFAAHAGHAPTVERRRKRP